MLKVRHITWVIENPRALVDLHKQKPISAVIEQVRDGSTVRAFLLPDFHYITLILSGVKVIMFTSLLCTIEGRVMRISAWLKNSQLLGEWDVSELPSCFLIT